MFIVYSEALVPYSKRKTKRTMNVFLHVTWHDEKASLRTWEHSAPLNSDGASNGPYTD